MENINYKTKDGMIVLNSLIKFLLSTEPELRDSDNKLVKRVYEIYRVDIHNIPFSEVVDRITRNEIPSFESIGRSRRKIQEQNDDLKSSLVIQKQKQRIENEFRNFALSE